MKASPSGLSREYACLCAGHILYLSRRIWRENQGDQNLLVQRNTRRQHGGFNDFGRAGRPFLYSRICQYAKNQREGINEEPTAKPIKLFHNNCTSFRRSMPSKISPAKQCEFVSYY